MFWRFKPFSFLLFSIKWEDQALQGSVLQGQNVPFVCSVYHFPMLSLVVPEEEETLQVLTCSLLDMWLSNTKSG